MLIFFLYFMPPLPLRLRRLSAATLMLPLLMLAFFFAADLRR